MFVKNLKEVFRNQLSSIYTISECDELFYIFVEETLGLNKITTKINLEKAIPIKQQAIFENILSELKTGKPYQQILGKTNFYSLTFFVDQHVLIPRPETEELVHIILTELQTQRNKSLKILDIGTGSGCIPITLATYLPHSKITSIDISDKAIAMAKKNAKHHQVNIQFLQKDYLKENLNDSYDIIVSNPPYIDTSEMNDIPFSVRNFEPNTALFAPPNKTLAFYEKIAEDCKQHLLPNGFIFLEINQKLGLETINLFLNTFPKSKLLKDLSGNHRFIIVRK